MLADMRSMKGHRRVNLEPGRTKNAKRPSNQKPITAIFPLYRARDFKSMMAAVI